MVTAAIGAGRAIPAMAAWERGHVVAKLNVASEQLAAFCRTHRIRRLAVFGSVLREDFGPDSDVDLLVEFESGHSPGWDILHVEEDCSRLFGGRRIHIVNPRYLNRRLKERVLQSAVVQYQADHE